MGLNEETKYEITNFINSLIRFIRLAAICDYRSLNERAVVVVHFIGMPFAQKIILNHNNCLGMVFQNNVSGI